jgi:hypothetical protein
MRMGSPDIWGRRSMSDGIRRARTASLQRKKREADTLFREYRPPWGSPMNAFRN